MNTILFKDFENLEKLKEDIVEDPSDTIIVDPKILFIIATQLKDYLDPEVSLLNIEDGVIGEIFGKNIHCIWRIR